MVKYHDLAIRWNDKRSSIRRLIEAGCVSVYRRPWRVGGAGSE